MSIDIIFIQLTESFLSTSTNKPVIADPQGRYHIKMHKLYRILGIAGFAVAAVFLFAPLIVKDDDLFFYVLTFGVAAMFGGLSLLSFCCYRNHYVRFDDKIVEVAGVFGGRKTFYWNQVKKISFNKNSGFLQVSSFDGEKIKIHQHLVGFPTFVSFLQRHSSIVK